MPTQALTLALASSIYPPALAAVIAIARGPAMRSRLLTFALAALLTSMVLGVAMLELLLGLDVSGSSHRTPSSALQLAIGVALIVVALYLRRRWRRPPPAPHEHEGSSRMERYLSSGPLAFVLGVTFYALPSPQFVGMVKAIADAKLSHAGELLSLLAGVVVMLWMVELPVLMLLAQPERATAQLERLNAWLDTRGRALLVWGLLAVGIYVSVNGLVDLLG